MTNKGEISKEKIGYCETIGDLKKSLTICEIIKLLYKKVK